MTDRAAPRYTVLISPGAYTVLMTRGGRFLLFCGAVLLLACIGLGSFLLGRHSASSDFASATILNQQLQTEGQRTKHQLAELSAQFTNQQAKLKAVQAELDAIKPSENTFNIAPNQSLIVGSGRITLALIGSPTNEGITININGKQQTVAAGDVLDVAIDASTTCQVTVQSFDVFKAVLNATCPGAAGKSK